MIIGVNAILTRRISWIGGAAALVLAVGGAVWRSDAQPADRVYVIGTDNAFPYHFLTDRGEAGGMVGGVIQEAARRSGVRLEWRLRPDGPTRALKAKAVDLWPLVAAQPAVWPDVYFTQPYLRNAYVALSLDPNFGTKPGWMGKVGILGAPLARRLSAQAFPGAQIVGFPSREKALAAVCTGQVDGASLEARTAQHLALNRPPGCEGAVFYTLGLDVPSADLSIAATKGNEAVADRLRAEIGTMQADGTMARLLRKWNYYYSGEAETIYREMQARSAIHLSHWLTAGLVALILALLLLLVRFRHAQKAALQASAAKSHFVANISHEIRTPLNGILGLGQLLDSTHLTAEQQEYLTLMMGSGRVLLGMVNDVLDLAQVEGGQLKVHAEWTDLRSLVLETTRVFELQARAKGIGLRCEGLEGLPERVQTDGARFRQVLTNLVANALKFTDSGEVVVRVERQPGELRVEVRDTGIGVAEESRKLLFRKFSQADETISKRFGGSGLGLAISRDLVVLMGGGIGMRSRDGGGSVFWFTLPLPAASDEPAPKQAIVEVRPAAAAQGASILLVEDNLVNQRIATRMVEKAGYRVTTAADGEAALRAWESGRFDAVLMDCQMPGIDGYQTTAEIRKREQGLPRTPIIALTASALKGDRERCLAAGMDDFLSKPVDLADLHRALNSWAGPGRGQ